MTSLSRCTTLSNESIEAAGQVGTVAAFNLLHDAQQLTNLNKTEECQSGMVYVLIGPIQVRSVSLA